MSEYLTGDRPNITFLKNVYKRHTDVLSKKEIRQFENNRLLVPLDDKIEVIEKMWISNVNNIKNIALFIVDDNVDINTVTVNDSDTEDNNSVMLINKLNYQSLQTYNKIYLNHNEINSNANCPGYALVPCSKNCLVSALLIHRQRKVLIVIDLYDQTMQPNLVIKYAICNSLEEIRRFVQINHQYLIKKFQTYQHVINPGTNEINIEFVNKAIAYIVINTDKNISSALYIKCKYTLDCNIITIDRPQPYVETYERNLIEASQDPEYYSYRSSDFDTYILDSYLNVRTFSTQPAGHFLMKEGSKIIINSTAPEQSNINITYVLFDVLNYMNDGVSRIFFEGARHEVVTAEGDDSPIEDQNLSLDIFPLGPQPNAPAIDEVLPEDNPVAVDNINWIPIVPQDIDIRSVDSDDDNPSSYTDIDPFYKFVLKRMLNKFEKQHAFDKSLPDDKDDCIISWNKIKHGDYYYECAECRGVFSVIELKKWFKTKKYSGKASCPQCRYDYYFYPILYKNTANFVSSAEYMFNPLKLFVNPSWVKNIHKMIYAYLIPFNVIKIKQCA